MFYLVGPKYYDKVAVLDKELKYYEAWGGIEHCCKYFMDYARTINVPVNEYLFKNVKLINLEKREIQLATSLSGVSKKKVDFQKCILPYNFSQPKFKPTNDDIVHFAYLDEINISKYQIKDFCGKAFTSADYTLDNIENLETCPETDFVFINNNDYFAYFVDKDIMNVICHTGDCISWCHNSQAIQQVSINKLSFVDTIGAGDYFAMAFLDFYRKNNYKVSKDILIYAHNQTVKYLICKESNANQLSCPVSRLG